MRQNRVLFASLAVLASLAPLTGCDSPGDTSPPTPQPAAAAHELLLADEPAGAVGVIQMRETAQDQDLVVVEGRVGGSEDPWVEGRAAFSIVDLSLVACSDRPGDDCPVPWDYCCETDRLPSAHALVKFTDANGRLIPHDARQLFPLKELQTVVVQGTAHRDEAGNVSVLASGLFVRP